jgi:hypothetical protein
MESTTADRARPLNWCLVASAVAGRGGTTAMSADGVPEVRGASDRWNEAIDRDD